MIRKGLHALVVLSLFSIPMTGQQLKRWQFESPYMGTLFSVTLYAETEQNAEAAAHAAFEEVEAVNQIFSDYELNSEINQLTRHISVGESYKISDPLAEVWDYANRFSHLTEGAFDVTVGPLSKLWRRAFRRQQFPTKAAVSSALEHVGYAKIDLHPSRNEVSFKDGLMKLDFGAIAKGYALDRMAWRLRKEGIHQFLCDGGGDLLLNDPPPGQKGWRVELPSGKKLKLANCGIATSGDQYKYLEWEGKRYSHIIDPRTGYGITGGLTVTVISASGMEADTWASTIIVLGKRKGKRLLKRQQHQVAKVYFHKK